MTTEEEMTTQEEAGNPSDEPNQHIDEGFNISEDIEADSEEDTEDTENEEKETKEISISSNGNFSDEVISICKNHGIEVYSNSVYVPGLNDVYPIVSQSNRTIIGLHNGGFELGYQIVIDECISEDEAKNAFKGSLIYF